MIAVTLQTLTLPLQLHLLAYDSRRKRFAFDRSGASRPGWMFEYALRSSMFTELYLTGVVTDRNGGLSILAAAPVGDPLLSAAMSVAVEGRAWAGVIRSGGSGTVAGAWQQLERDGWFARRDRRFGAPRFDVRDPDVVDAIAARVVAALENVLREGDAEPRALALGLIAFQAQMPVVDTFLRHEGKRAALHSLTDCAIEPIHVLRTLILARFDEMRRSTSG